MKATILTNDFGSSSVNRKLWEPQNVKHNIFTSRDNPGPGAYDENENLAVTKKQFNAEGKNSIFLSKVPNCKDSRVTKQDFPGPGTYKNPDEVPAKLNVNAPKESQMES